MTPEELGRIAFDAIAERSPGALPFDFDSLGDDHKNDFISAALAVAAAVKREDAGISKRWLDHYVQTRDDSTEIDEAYSCGKEAAAEDIHNAILATIPEGK